MSADHRRPLFAFFVVASVCALLIGQGLRSESILDYIVGRSASLPASASVGDPVTLTPAPGASAVPPASPSGDGTEKPAAGSAKGGSGGDRRGNGDSRPGKGGGNGLPPGHASGHGQGGGKPSQVGDGKPGRGHGKAHGGRSRVGDDGPGKGKGHGKGGKGRGQGHGSGKGPSQPGGKVPDHAQGPRH